MKMISSTSFEYFIRLHPIYETRSLSKYDYLLSYPFILVVFSTFCLFKGRKSFLFACILQMTVMWSFYPQYFGYTDTSKGEDRNINGEKLIFICIPKHTNL